MDLLRTMVGNRHASGTPPAPIPRRKDKKKTKADRARENEPGSKRMREFIIEEKPSKKIVREHFDAMIEEACKEDSD